MKTDNKLQCLVGQVVSDKMQKTIVVTTVVTSVHPQFKKVMRSTRKFKVHDENQEARIGDVVEFKVVRPISRDKYMTLVRVVKSDILNASNNG